MIQAVRWMLRRVGLAVLAMLPIGCSVRHVPVLELHRSQLVTPTGNVPLEIASEKHSDRYAANYEQRLVARYEDLSLRLCVLWVDGQSLLVDSSGSHEVTIAEDEAFYRLDGGERQGIRFRLPVVDPRGVSHRFDFELPGPLATYEVAIRGGSLVPEIVERIEAGEGDVHEIHIPFRVDGKPFAIDLEFEVSIRTRRYFAPPATP